MTTDCGRVGAIRTAVLDETTSIRSGPAHQPVRSELAQSVPVVPDHVRQVVDAWRAAGSPLQGTIAWPRQRWIDEFPVHATTFSMLPDRLSRPVVRRACLNAAVSPADAERSFLAVMAWGYGRVGYGPFRVRRVLDAAPSVGAQLQAAACTVGAGRPVEAYARLGDHGAARLPHLGPAFGTKFLYFCSPAGTRPALILDRLVARWLSENVGLAFNELRWSVSTYARYLETMFGWADELALAADELENCIFSRQAALGDSQWAPADPV